MKVDPTVVKLGLGGFGLYTFYGLAIRGSLGTEAQDWAYQLRSAWGGTPTKFIAGPSGGTTPQSGSQTSPAPSGTPKTTPVGTGTPQSTWLTTTLADLGDVPVQYNPATGALRQDPGWVKQFAPSGYSANTYTSGVFRNTDTGEIVPFSDAQAYVLAVA